MQSLTTRFNGIHALIVGLSLCVLDASADTKDKSIYEGAVNKPPSSTEIFRPCEFSRLCLDAEVITTEHLSVENILVHANLTANGNVGIGLDNPEEVLHVQDVNEGVIKVGTATPNGDAAIIFEEGGTDAMALRYDGGTNDLKITDETSNRTTMMIKRSGPVGFGTTTPVSNVSILGDSGQDVGMDISTKETNHKSSLKLCEGAGCEAGMYWEYDGTDNRIKLYGVELGAIFGPHITVNRETGRVGIGTDNPTEQLTVNGKILSEEVEVVASIADYVFDPGYRRMSLDELEQYIKENRHLPGISSSKEVVERGGTISVGESYTRLLEKIEELTLYIIEQDRKIRELQDVVEMKNDG